MTLNVALTTVLRTNVLHCDDMLFGVEAAQFVLKSRGVFEAPRVVVGDSGAFLFLLSDECRDLFKCRASTKYYTAWHFAVNSCVVVNGQLAGFCLYIRRTETKYIRVAKICINFSTLGVNAF